MTRLKIYVMNAIIVLGSLAIAWMQFPEAMKPHGYDGGFRQNAVASLFEASLLTAIPLLLFAVGAYVVLAHVLFTPDELKTYRARRLVESLDSGRSRKQAKPEARPAGAPSVKHDD